MEEEKQIVCHGHVDAVTELFYSSDTPDGFFLLSASKDFNLILREGKTGAWLGTISGHSGPVWSCCFNEDAGLAASASLDRTVRVWDALNGLELKSLAHGHIVRACSFSKDSHQLLTGGIEKILRVFDLNNLEEPAQQFVTPNPIGAVAWIQNDNAIVSSKARGGGVSLWDIRSGKHFQTLHTEFTVTSLEVSRDGRLITIADGSTVSFWDTNGFKLVKSHKMPFNVESASLEPKYGNKFVVGGEGMQVHTYNFVSGGCEDKQLHAFSFQTGEGTANDEGHPKPPVHSVRFSPCGEFYASGSEDGTVRIWTTGPAMTDENEVLNPNGI